MTLREEIKDNRREFWRDSDSTQMGEELELIIERVDGMDDRISEIESKIINLLLRMDSVEFLNKVISTGGTITSGNLPDSSELFPGYNDLMKEAIPAIREYIAEKKRELDHKVVPMKVSED